MDLKKEFAKVLRGIAIHEHADRVFDDFLTLASCSLRNSFQRSGPEFQEVEDEYLEVAKRYSGEQLRDFSHLIALVVEGLGDPTAFCDFLGEVYMSEELGNSRMGQFFTPYSVSLMAARLNMGALPSPPRLVTVQEPACGSGGMVLGLCQAMAEAGFNYQHWVYAEATDLDERCFRMAYIQLSLAMVPAVVRHGNTLSGEVFRAWPTVAMVTSFMDVRLKRHRGQIEAGEAPSPTPLVVPISSAPVRQLEMVF